MLGGFIISGLKLIFRIYGDKGPEIIEGLKKTPVVAIPVILRRLEAKDAEWRAAQKVSCLLYLNWNFMFKEEIKDIYKRMKESIKFKSWVNLLYLICLRRKIVYL